jgi:molybdopterin-guanine dinucleotide biosynthesis protein A
MPEDVYIRSLVLAGGKSSRMGSPKYRLETAIPPQASVPLIAKVIKVHQICQDDRKDVLKLDTMISTRDASQDEELQTLFSNSIVEQTRLRYENDRIPDNGPASGLLRAHEHDPEAHWLVTGCDYALLEVETLLTLINEHLDAGKAITCFSNAEGWNEPLLAIWSPTALSKMQDLSQEASAIGPNRVIREYVTAEAHVVSKEAFCYGVHIIKPAKESWLRSTDTKDDWEAVQPELLSNRTWNCTAPIES